VFAQARTDLVTVTVVDYSAAPLRQMLDPGRVSAAGTNASLGEGINSC
jgi:hypothetical protein